MRKICCLALFVIAVSPVLHASITKYSGEAVVRSIKENRIAVFVDTNGDHSVDKGFLLTMDVPMHKGLSVHFDAANVEFTDGYVRVMCDKKLYDLQVAGYPDPPDAPAGSEVVTLIGSALTHSDGDAKCDIRHAQEGEAESCYQYGRD